MARVITKIATNIANNFIWKKCPISQTRVPCIQNLMRMSSSSVSTAVHEVKEEESLPVEDSSNSTTTAASVDSQEAEKKDRVKKRKMAVLLSYCGQGYFGMQKNPSTKTIEDELLQALMKASYIDEETYNKPQYASFQRAARTDKNVSAARQIVSLKLPENIELDKVNCHLPPQIRVMGVRRVTKGFDSKGNCDARTYMYMLPSFAFVPVDGLVTEDYRITPEILEEVRKTLQMYLGTKSFYNFTSGRKPTDPSVHRFIMSFTCSDPFLEDGLEYVILKVKGQSFMLHQIRKMIGLVVAIMRGYAGKETVEKVWKKQRIDIPRAPGVGLVLDQVHYERYDFRYGKDHDKLTWEAENEAIEKFCHEYIYPVITKCENEEKSFLEWMKTLIWHTYDIREQGQPARINRIGQAFLHAGLISKAKESDDEEGDDDDDDDGPKSKVPKMQRSPKDD